MIDFDDIIKENIKEHNLHWSKIPGYSCRILITIGSGSKKTNNSFNQ